MSVAARRLAQARGSAPAVESRAENRPAIQRAEEMLADRAEHEGPDFRAHPLISRLRMVVFDLTKLADAHGISMERLVGNCRTFDSV